MYVKTVDRTAVLAWSPNFQQQPFIATGTVSGALDASFSTNSELELFNVSLQERDPVGVKVASVPCNARFNRLSWSSHQSSILAGGLEDGTVCLWDAGKLMSGQVESSLIDTKSIYGGPVRGLQFSPHTPFLLAIGSVDAQISLIDINDTNKVYMPGPNKSQRLEDVTDLAWNPKVGHILAASSSNGLTVIWDLRAKKEALQFAVSGQRGAISALSWNPDLPNQLVCACEDNTTPFIYSWDLRNAHSPDRHFSGHSKGVLSVAWCPKDPELLLSSGKDNRTIFWNPKSASIIGELPSKENWVFDVQWCPKNPDLLSVASFDGKIDIYSFQAVSSSLSGAAQPIKEDLFGHPMSPLSPQRQHQQQSSSANNTIISSTNQPSSQQKQVPKWLKCPVGVRFGFGGRLAVFRPNSRNVTIHSLASQATSGLEEAIANKTVSEYCQKQIDVPVKDLASCSTNNEGSLLWTVLKVLNESDHQVRRQHLLKLAGVTDEPQVSSAESNASPVTKGPSTLPPSSSLTTPTMPQPPSTISTVMADAGSFRPSLEETPTTAFSPDHQDFFSGSTDEFDILGDSTGSPNDQPDHGNLQRRSTFSGMPFSLYSTDATADDQSITKHIIAGNFRQAVEQCISADRLSDALLVAVCGGPELVARTQRIYFQKVRSPYLRVVSGILKRDLSDVVENASLADWPDLFGLVLSFSTDQSERDRLLSMLAQRLAVEPDTTRFTTPAIITYLTSGDTTKAAALLVRHAKQHKPPIKNHREYDSWLHTLFTRLRVAQLTQPTVPLSEMVTSVPDLTTLCLHHAFLLCESGRFGESAFYLSLINIAAGDHGDDKSVLVFADRVAQLSGVAALRDLPKAFDHLNLRDTSDSHVVPTSTKSASASTSYYNNPSAPLGQPYQSAPVGQPYQSAPISQPYQQSFQSYQQAPYQSQTSTIQPYQNSQTNQPYQNSQTNQPYPPSQSSQPYQGGQQVQPTARPAIPMPSNPILSSAPMTTTSSATGQPPYSTNTGTNQPYTTISTGTGQPYTSGSTSNQPYGTPYGQPSIPSIPPQPLPNTSTGTIPQPMSQPPRISAAEFSNNRVITEAFNDAPIVAPRQVAASPPVPVSGPSQSSIASHGSGVPPQPSIIPSQPSPTLNNNPPTQIQPDKKQQALGPADPTKMLPHHLPIYHAIQQLIHDCQQHCTPLQKRSIDDAARRLQTLSSQLTYQALSEPVLHRLTDLAGMIKTRQYGSAMPIVHELTTNHFAETGAWILGLRRLLECSATL